MSLLIDGYNLLNAVGITGQGAGATSLERSRRALLNFLAESLDPTELPTTTIVFDSHAAPPGLPRIVGHRGLKIRFAAQYDDADALLEELIRADTAPRRLTVVSSDHRIQRAARRRRAKAVDSDVWYSQLIHHRRPGLESSPKPETPAKPGVPLLEEEVERWLRQFGGESLLDELIAEAQIDEPPGDVSQPSSHDKKTLEKPAGDEAAQIGNPFPPGYGEDLEDEIE